MLKNWLITLLRFGSRNKLSFTLNFVGLIIGLACSFSLLNYILYEFGYDQMHINKKNIFRVNTNLRDLDWKLAYTPYILREYLESIPEIRNSVTIGRVNNANLQFNNETISLKNFRTANKEIFDVFTFQFIQGSAKNALNSPNSLVVGREFIDKYYKGNFNIIGSTVDIEISDVLYTFIISGIIEDLTDQSSEQIQLIANIDFDKNKSQGGTKSINEEALWKNNSYLTFVLLENKANITAIEEKLEDITNINCRELNITYFLQPLLKIHLFSSNYNNSNTKGILKIYLFLIVGISIFLVTCSNFTLFSIAQNSLRIKEVGVRKVFGASRSSLVSEYLIESLIISAISFPLAIIVSNIFSHEVSKNFGAYFYFNVWSNPGLLLAFLLLSILLAFIGGIIYSFKISRKDPYSLIKQEPLLKNRKISFSIILISVQIAIFVSLFTSSQIIYAQVKKGIEMDKGFNDQNLVVFSLTRDSKIPNYLAFKEDLILNPNIFGVTGGANLPPSYSSSKAAIILPEKPNSEVFANNLYADQDLAKVLQLRIIKGRWFSDEFISDSEKLIINNKLLVSLELQDSSNDYLLSQNIIGVIEDFTFKGAKESIEPIRIVLNPELYNRHFIVRCNLENLADVKNHINSVIDKNGLTLDSEILPFRELIKSRANREIQMLKILIIFGIVTILMAILGLFGHSIFIAQNKIYDCGIRKIFGAREKDILIFYLTDFIAPIVSANVFSALVIYYLMSNWLQNYAYHINIDFSFFLISAVFSIIIVLLSVLYNFKYLYLVNPVDLIRYE